MENGAEGHTLRWRMALRRFAATTSAAKLVRGMSLARISFGSEMDNMTKRPTASMEGGVGLTAPVADSFSARAASSRVTASSHDSAQSQMQNLAGALEPTISLPTSDHPDPNIPTRSQHPTLALVI